jgi:hypothetical protein
MLYSSVPRPSVFPWITTVIDVSFFSRSPALAGGVFEGAVSSALSYGKYTGLKASSRSAWMRARASCSRAEDGGTAAE